MWSLSAAAQELNIDPALLAEWEAQGKAYSIPLSDALYFSDEEVARLKGWLEKLLLMTGTTRPGEFLERRPPWGGDPLYPTNLAALLGNAPQRTLEWSLSRGGVVSGCYLGRQGYAPPESWALYLVEKPWRLQRAGPALSGWAVSGLGSSFGITLPLQQVHGPPKVAGAGGQVDTKSSQVRVPH